MWLRKCIFTFNFIYYLAILNLNSHMRPVAALWGSLASGDLRAQLLDMALACSPAPGLPLSLGPKKHSWGQTTAHTPVAVHMPASWPETPFLSSHLQAPWKSCSGCISPRQLCLTLSHLTSSRCWHSLSLPPLSLCVVLSLSPSQSCHSSSMALTDYGNFKGWVSFIPSPLWYVPVT